MKRFSTLLLAAALSTCWAAASHGDAHFTARFSGAQETPGVGTPALGTGHFTLTSAGLQFYISVEGLAPPIMAAEFADAPPGMPGPVVRDIISEFAGTNNAAGLWAPTDAQPLTSSLVSELMAGNIYVNIHTPPFPGGETRGQVQLSDGVHLTANLQGSQVNPPVVVPGTGAGSFTLTEEGLQYKITLNNVILPITAAGISNGAIGVNGPVVFPIGATFVGNNASGFISGLPPAVRKSLLAGDMYLDVLYPGGEIRGQINLAGGFGFTIQLDGVQETPPVGTPALGMGSATLTASGLDLDLTATAIPGGIIAAHLNNAPAGVPGPIVRDILPDLIPPVNTTARVLWRADDPQPLKPSMVGELLQNRIYVNLDTPANPTGEIRGQLVLQNPGPGPGSYMAKLTPQQVEPPIAAPSRGTATFQISPFGLAFRATFDGVAPLGPIEFHSGAIGVNGPIVRVITGPEVIGPNTIRGVWSPGDPMPFTAALMTELMKGNIYLLVRTAAFPPGELRGQIVPSSGAEFETRMTSFQEVPPNGSPALATGSFTLTPNGLALNISADIPGPIIGANIRFGQRGVVGPVVRDLLPEFAGTRTAAGVWKPSDAMPLTPALVTELLKGNLYVNIETPAVPPGEIRGQITLAGGDPHEARPAGMQELPPVATKGKGIVAATLTDEGFLFRMTNNDLLALPTAARIENGPVGAVGPVARPLYAGEGLGMASADAVWKTTDADPLTTALLGELFNERLYMNVQTGAVPTGEVRGQFGSPFSSVGVQEPLVSGAELQLSNAPNPAQSGRTSISFFLPKRSDVSLAVYDVTGAQVKRLLQGSREAGWHHVAFDAEGLSSGMYFYRLDAANMSAKRKLIVMR